MQLHADGAQLFRAVFSPAEVERLVSLLHEDTGIRPGRRLTAGAGLETHIAPATALARDILGPAAQPVRGTFFDKSADRNWSLGWHQDRTIAVRGRIDVDGFTHWTFKSGIYHVMPPVQLLARMLTLRIHLDRVDAGNAPLLVSPGTHRYGRIAEADVPTLVHRHGEQACLAEAGDLWLYATPILHASARAAKPRRRRVLQLLYSAHDLPGGLQWLGI